LKIFVGSTKNHNEGFELGTYSA